MESVVFQKTVIESTFDYGIEAKYEYWIVHFMNGLLNQQTKSFSLKRGNKKEQQIKLKTRKGEDERKKKRYSQGGTRS